MLRSRFNIIKKYLRRGFMESAPKTKDFIALKTSAFGLKAESAWKSLDLKEKSYAYYLTKGSWGGWPACVFQRSFESPALVYLAHLAFRGGIDKFKAQAQEAGINKLRIGASEIETNQVMAFFSGVLQNCGNYRSFGDNKFVPEVSGECLEKVLKGVSVSEEEKARIDEILKTILPLLYKTDDPFNLMNFRDKKGTTAYYSANVTSQDAETLQALMDKAKISPINTRAFKLGEKEYQVRIAAAECKVVAQVENEDGAKCRIVIGDYAPFMKEMATAMGEAQPHAANEHQLNMVKAYEEHFQRGNIEVHKDSQRHWIKDSGPIVETNLGFIETYVDPKGVRAEYEGFVAIVDKEISAQFNELVANAEELITKLPWGKEFEKDKFHKPDFTDLKVITFASSDCPIGINIPNYDDIRMNEGFKNVNLGNAYSRPKLENVKFLPKEDAELFVKWDHEALTLIVALHELLGHGTGKLFTKNQQTGEQNFDSKTLNPITGQPVTTFYSEKETWGSKFGSLHSGYEECRADTVALYLMQFEKPYEIFVGHLKDTPNAWDQIYFVGWLDILMGGLKGLQFYDVENKKWMQAHVLASYVILRVVIEKNEKIIQFDETKDSNGDDYFIMRVDRKLLKTEGFDAISQFLKKLHILKSIGDFENGKKFFDHYSEVDERFVKFRDIVIRNKTPRRLLLQPNIIKKEDGFEYKEYEENFEGIINSYLNGDRFGQFENFFENIYAGWNKDKEAMNPLTI